MLDIRFNSELDYKIDNLGFVKVMRNKDFSFPWRNGKDRHSLIFVERGKMEYNFLNEQNIISANKGELLFIPKNYPYVGTYLEDNTVIRIILFDADKLPQTLSHPIIRKHPPELGSGDTKNTLFLAARVYELLYFLTKDTAYVPKKYSKIIPAIKEFEKNYFLNEKLSHYTNHRSNKNDRKPRIHSVRSGVSHRI